VSCGSSGEAKLSGLAYLRFSKPCPHLPLTMPTQSTPPDYSRMSAPNESTLFALVGAGIRDRRRTSAFRLSRHTRRIAHEGQLSSGAPAGMYRLQAAADQAGPRIPKHAPQRAADPRRVHRLAATIECSWNVA
jgi:hypothetical protein